MNRREFSKKVKVEILTRCKTPTGFRCENCGCIVTSGDIDHTTPDGLEIDKSTKLTADDGKFLCHPCHDEKTKVDVKVIAKAKRIEARHLGAMPAPKVRLMSRGFPKVEKRPAIDKSCLPPLPRKWV